MRHKKIVVGWWLGLGSELIQQIGWSVLCAHFLGLIKVVGGLSLLNGWSEMRWSYSSYVNNICSSIMYEFWSLCSFTFTLFLSLCNCSMLHCISDISFSLFIMHWAPAISWRVKKDKLIIFWSTNFRIQAFL